MARLEISKLTTITVLSLLMAFICTGAVIGGVKTLCDIQTAQLELNRLKIDVGPADGIWGKSTAAAVKEFQNRNGFSETGNLDAQTCDALGVMKLISPIKSCESVLKEWTTSDMAKIAAKFGMTPETAKMMGIKAPAVVPPKGCSLFVQGSRVTPHCKGKAITHDSCSHP